jgi:hypothetical protein
MNQSPSRQLQPFIIIFIILNCFFLLGKGWLAGKNIQYEVLMAANFLFFVLNILSFRMQRNAHKKGNPQVFVRTVMASMMLKMVLCITAVLIYVVAFKTSFSKLSVFACLAVYLVYLLAEVKTATTLNKQKNG